MERKYSDRQFLQNSKDNGNELYPIIHENSSQSTNLICISDFLSQKLQNPLLGKIMHILIPFSLQNQRLLKIFT